MGLFGLVKHAVFWPVTGPKYLIDFSLKRVEGVVREELTDDSRIKAELMELQLMLELGDIDDDEYVRREAELMARLREVRDWRERFGMGVSGGPVRVAGTGREDEERVGGHDVGDAPQTARGTGPRDDDDRSRGDEDEGARRGGIASPFGAEIHLDFD